MVYNYLKIFIRNFLHDRMYTFIIVFGLAIGIATCLMIAQYIHFELSFDNDIKERDRIYYTYLNWGEGSDTPVDGKCFPAIAPFAERSIPEVEAAVRIVSAGFTGIANFALKREEEGKLILKAYADRQYVTDASVLNFFEIPVLAGDPTSPLQEPNTMVITRSIAEKFFPGEDPINKTLIAELTKSIQYESKITAVVEDPAPNASFRFNVLYSIATLKKYWDVDQTWTGGDFETFLKLHPGADFKTVEGKINTLAEPLRPLEAQFKFKLYIHLYPFKDFHFFRHHNTQTSEGIQFTGDKKLIKYFFLLGVLIMIISWANYINLTTARSLRRAKEVGLRKVNGANRKNLVVQFLVEFSLLNLVSILLAFTIAQLLFPIFARMLGSDASWIFWTKGWFWLITLVAFVISTLVSGIYPSLVLSQYNPSRVLKGNFSRSQSGISVRKGLVILQFAISAIMIMSIYVISRQLYFMQTKDLGIAIDQVLVIRTNDLDTALDRGKAFQQLKVKLANSSGVKSMSSAGLFPGENSPRQMVVQLVSDADKKTRGLMTNDIGENYFATMGLEIVLGRDFIAGSRADIKSAIVNQTATRVLGLKSPDLAIGEKVIFSDTGEQYEIVGVVKDFSLNLKEPPMGEIFTIGYPYSPSTVPANVFIVKLSTDNVRITLSTIEKEWKSLFPATAFDYFFLDTYFDTFYKEEERFAAVFGFFSVVGIVITGMGLFGLSLFDTTNRTKEIGIRKSLGASVNNIIWLFSKDYIKLVMLSILFGIPIAILMLNEWLASYPQHINLQADTIIMPMVMLMIIALITVGYHTWRTARHEPVTSLRSE